LTILATSEPGSPTRRQENSNVVSSKVQHRRSTSVSTPGTPTYRVYAHSERSPSASLQDVPAAVVTQITEETQIFHIPPSQSRNQQQSEVTYTVQDKQPKHEPVAFQVSTTKENAKQKGKPPLAKPPAAAPPPTQAADPNDPNPFKIFGAKLRSRSTQGIVPSYDE